MVRIIPSGIVWNVSKHKHKEHLGTLGSFPLNGTVTEASWRRFLEDNGKMIPDDLHVTPGFWSLRAHGQAEEHRSRDGQACHDGGDDDEDADAAAGLRPLKYGRVAAKMACRYSHGKPPWVL